MSYAILRTEKLKTSGGIAGSLAHTYRTRNTPNADPTRETLNEHYGAATDPVSVRAAIKALLPEKRRSDAVLCIEYFVGASPEFFRDGGDAESYFKAAVRWLQDKHGAANLVAWSIHRDETSPHLVAYVVPLDPAGKLNAKHFLGGRQTLSAMQTDFAVKVGAPVGLERGIEGSKATHTTIKQYYQALGNPDFKHGRVLAKLLEPKVLAKRLLSKTVVESPEQVAKRVTKVMRDYYAPALSAAATGSLDKRKAKEMAQTAKAKEEALRKATEQLKAACERIASLEGAFVDGLTAEQHNELAAQAATLRHQNWLAAEFNRRSFALVDMLKTAAGAALVFAKQGVAALDAAGGRANAVDWEKVEADTTTEAEVDLGFSTVETLAAVLEHSPKYAGVDPAEVAEVLAEVAELERREASPDDFSPRPKKRFGPAPR